MITTAHLTRGSYPRHKTPVDAYAILRAPDGNFYSLQPDGNLVPGIVRIVTDLAPASFTKELLRHTFVGEEPEGNYKWFTALTVPGALNIVGAVVEYHFSFSR